ncbi:MAG: cysteine--tRNA ligase [Patescibacteria group bacterium]|nr:cysteine--tRNA ligase [Patescibacteria group bacterium]
MLSRLFQRAHPNRPPLRLHNTLSGALEEFTALSSREVKMYNCGPTVYDRQHIGNLRSYVLADTLRRALLYWGYSLKQVINITDVGHLVSDADEGEDKMEASAKKQGRSAKDIASEYTDAFLKDLDALGIDRTHILFPRATEYISEQIALVKTLLEKGYAYEIADGIYFDVSRFPSYGKLGGIKLSGLREGARVEENPEKHGPYDFALWKRSPPGVEREQEWNSPWGVGFPGWHIECTAMIFKLLGKQIDIHTGGVDHIPVHHNNEIAQAEAATGKRYVKYWLHNEFITIEGKKISKSLGNTVYLYNVADRGLSPKVLRYWFLTAHYRSPINFTWEALEGAASARDRLLRHFFEEYAQAEGGTPDESFMRNFLDALAHDLDTPKALAAVWEMVRNESLSPAVKRASLLEVDTLLGIGIGDARERMKLSVIPERELPEEIQKLLQEREEARASKDFTRADVLRRELQERGYEISDTPEGSRISKIN